MQATSHRQVYEWIVANLDKANTFDSHFASWTTAEAWIELTEPEYLYPISQIYDGAVDWARFFREHPQPFEHLSADLPVDHDVAGRLKFYASFDFNDIFVSDSTPETREKVAELNRAREEAGQYLLINPHASGIYNRKRAESSTWKLPEYVYKGIPGRKRPSFVVDPLPDGALAIVDAETARERFCKFTCGIFEPMAELEFPWEKVIFAGGSITKILSTTFTPESTAGSDLDMFIVGDSYTERRKTMEEVLRWFHAKGASTNESGDTFYAITGSVVSIFIRGVPRTFQAISDNSTSVWAILSRFDLTHIQWAARGSPYNGSGMQWFGTPAAVDTAVTGVAKICMRRRVKTLRIVKALTCGYEIEIDDEIEEHLAISSLLNPATPQTLIGMLDKIGGYYHPEANAADDRIFSQIEMFVKPSLSSMDIEFAIQNIFIGGNFEDNYESLNFKAFQVIQLVLNPRRRGALTMMSTRYGEARFLTDRMTVKLVSANENGDIEFHTHISGELVEFIRMLETTGFKIYAGNRTISESVVNNNVVSWRIPRHIIERQFALGRTCLKSQTGEHLSLADDLATDDKIQVIFKVEVKANDGCRIRLVPSTIIKFETTVATEFDKAVTEALAAATIEDGKSEIEYTD